jgi:hypothetical protein
LVTGGTKQIGTAALEQKAHLPRHRTCRLKVSEGRPSDAAHHIRLQKLADEDVTVGSDSLPERSPIAQQGSGICQFGRTIHQVHSHIVEQNCAETMGPT